MNCVDENYYTGVRFVQYCYLTVCASFEQQLINLYCYGRPLLQASSKICMKGSQILCRIFKTMSKSLYKTYPTILSIALITDLINYIISCYWRPLLQAWLLPDLNTIPNNYVRENSLQLSGYGIGFSTKRPWFKSCLNLIFLPCIY